VRTLIVSATTFEIAPLLARLGVGTGDTNPRLTRYGSGPLDIDVLVTGVGMVPTAAWCARTLADAPYRRAFNFGVCGSFDPTLDPGRVVHVTADRFPEVGAEDGDGRLTLEQMGLRDEGVFPFRHGCLTNDAPPEGDALAALPRVQSITVNTVHGDAASIAAVVERCHPQVESMEGAAFMYACLIHGVPFAQVRAVSNRVERRNRNAWRLDDAVRNLGDAALRILEAA
jgi:futalosine hydrolase